MNDWHPKQIAQPSEWEMRNGWPPEPIGVIKRLELGPMHEVWFRAVTWAPHSDERALLGYTRSLDEAAAAIWRHRMATLDTVKDPRPNGR